MGTNRYNTVFQFITYYCKNSISLKQYSYLYLYGHIIIIGRLGTFILEIRILILLIFFKNPSTSIILLVLYVIADFSYTFDYDKIFKCKTLNNTYIFLHQVDTKYVIIASQFRCSKRVQKYFTDVARQVLRGSQVIILY